MLTLFVALDPLFLTYSSRKLLHLANRVFADGVVKLLSRYASRILLSPPCTTIVQ